MSDFETYYQRVRAAIKRRLKNRDGDGHDIDDWMVIKDVLREPFFRGVDTTPAEPPPGATVLRTIHGPLHGVREQFVCSCGMVTGEWGVDGELWRMSQHLVNKNPTAEVFKEALQRNHRPARGGGCI